MLYIFRYIAYIKRNMSYIFRFMSYIRRIMSYIFRYMSYIFRKLPNCRKKLPKSLELKSILHKKYCLQQRFVAIVGLGLFSVSLFFYIFFCLYLWRLGNSTPLLPQAAKRWRKPLSYTKRSKEIFNKRSVLKKSGWPTILWFFTVTKCEKRVKNR